MPSRDVRGMDLLLVTDLEVGNRGGSPGPYLPLPVAIEVHNFQCRVREGGADLVPRVRLHYGKSTQQVGDILQVTVRQLPVQIRAARDDEFRFPADFDRNRKVPIVTRRGLFYDMSHSPETIWANHVRRMCPLVRASRRKVARTVEYLVPVI